MAKLTLPTITSGYVTTAQLNTALVDIANEFQNKVLYRDNPVGEPNQLLNDIDFNSNSIINITAINGVPVSAFSDISGYVASASASATAAATSAAQASASATTALNTVSGIIPVVYTTSGDGVTTSFSLPTIPASKNLVNVHDGTSYILKNLFTLAANVVTFNTAPSAGTNNLEFIIAGPVSMVITGNEDYGLVTSGTAKVVQHRRGTTTDHSTFTGAQGEVTVDTTKWTVVVNDGTTAGGHPLATEANLALKAPIASPTFTGTVTLPGNAASALVAVPKQQLDAIYTTASTWSKAQRGAIVALTDGATITPDFSLSNNYSVTLAGNRTLAFPTNVVAGQSGIIAVTQDSIGSRTLTFAAGYVFSLGTAPSLTTTANAVDYLSYFVETTGRIYISITKDIR